MIWLWVIGLALAVLVAAIVLFRLPRAAACAVASALLLGLAGYAMQSEPDKAGSPVLLAKADQADGSSLIDARKPFFEDAPPSNHMILADAFARKGQYADAAAVLRGALRAHPEDAQGWLALGNALVAHANGTMSPPARLAYQRAALAAPGNPGPGFFLGVAELQAGNLVETHKLWSAALAAAPADAPGRELMEQRLARFDQLIRSLAEEQP